MADWSDTGEWLVHQHKLVELGYRNRFEFLKHSVEFSKIIITGLIAINSGGLVALPAYAALFFNVHNKSMASKLLISAGAFSVGVMSALICAFFTYLNYLAWSRRALSEAHEATHRAGQTRASLLRNQQMAEYAEEQLRNSLRPATVEVAKINVSHVYGMFCGWLAAFCFVGGAVWLAIQATMKF